MDNSKKLRLAYCQKIPKIELHAHIHGCLRKSTLQDFLKDINVPTNDEIFHTKDMKGAFRIFDYIHKTVQHLSQVRRIFREMIEDFQSHNVIYMEIRTTPRSFDNESEEDYVKALIDELDKRDQESKEKMTIKLLLSFSRSESLEKARRTLDLAKKYKTTGYIIGVDYSGSPYQKTFKDFQDIYQEARDYGLKVIVHTAELPDEKTSQETNDVLKFKPDRIGHFNYFNDRQLDELYETKIPIETCPTSNKYTMELQDYKEHHILKFYERKIPFCICTDDTIVFDTDISQELYRICDAFAFSEETAKEIVLRSIDCICADEEYKQKLKEQVIKFQFIE